MLFGGEPGGVADHLVLDLGLPHRPEHSDVGAREHQVTQTCRDEDVRVQHRDQAHPGRQLEQENEVLRLAAAYLL